MAAGHYSTPINGADIACVEWGEPGDTTVLLSHATGLHSRCWDAVAALLDGMHIIAADHRGHGASSNRPPYDWVQFGTDLTDLVVALDLSDIVGVGHSMGGHCMVQAAAREPDRFRALVLFDPVIFEPSKYAAPPVRATAVHPVARRRNTWASPREMFNSFADRSPFSRWRTDVLEAYCKHGLVRDGDVYTLACPPDIEAGIYLSSMNCDIHDLIERVEIPVTVVRAEARGFEAAMRDFSLSPTWPALAGSFRHGKDVYVPEFSHFLPMEDPVLAASIVRAGMD